MKITTAGLQACATIAMVASLAAQAQTYRDIVLLCLKFPLCTAVQTRGSYG